jgi:hypothetical protein
MVERDDCEAKLWLEPVRLEWSRGFPRHEIKRIDQIIAENQQFLLERWNEYFSP